MSDINNFIWIMMYFFLDYDLKINPQRVNCSTSIFDYSVVDEMANSIGCVYIKNSFFVSWVEGRGNMCKIDYWKEEVNKFKSSPSTLKAKTLSDGGRLALIN